MTKYISEVVDIAYHADKQNLPINVIKMSQAFYQQHKKIYGSFKYSSNYDRDMDFRYQYILDNVWDVINAYSTIAALKKLNIYDK